MRPNCVNDSQGFSLVEVLSIVAVLSISLTAVLIISVRMSQDVMMAPTINQLDIFRRNIAAAVMDSNAWTKTVSKNPALLNCKNVGACPIGFANAQTFKLYEARDPDPAAGPLDALVYDSTVANMGVSPEGTLCRTFDAVNPDPKCPFKFDMRWYAFNGGANPLIGVFATLQMSPFVSSKYKSLNISKYSVGTCSGAMVSAGGLLRCSNVVTPLVRNVK